MSAAQYFWYHLKINYKGCNQQKAKFHKPFELLLKLPIFFKEKAFKINAFSTVWIIQRQNSNLGLLGDESEV